MSKPHETKLSDKKCFALLTDLNKYLKRTIIFKKFCKIMAILLIVLKLNYPF